MEDNEIALLVQQCNEGKITVQELAARLAADGKRLQICDMSKDRHPAYPDGNNESRSGFTYNPYYHPKGKFFQNIVKKALLKCIDWAHTAIVKGYDMDAYKYDDPRLQAINTYMRGYIGTNFIESKPYKFDFMNKMVDIFMFMCKEDIYYRARILDMFKNMPHDYELTQLEIENINRWH